VTIHILLACSQSKDKSATVIFQLLEAGLQSSSNSKFPNYFKKSPDGRFPDKQEI
jgi:hypothetical protein